MDILRRHRAALAVMLLAAIVALLSLAPLISRATDVAGTPAIAVSADEATGAADATEGGASGDATPDATPDEPAAPETGGAGTDADATGEGGQSQAGETTDAAGDDAATSTEPAAETDATATTDPATDPATVSTTEGAAGAASSAADSQQDALLATAATGDVQILYEPGDANAEGGGLHYVYSVPDDPTSEILYLYCMNNSAHWPHATPGIGSVPDYTLGYLTPSMFSSEADYEACMAKLKAILYAGYPYNGMGYYTEVADDQAQSVTGDEFNQMLVPPANIAADFPDTAGSTTFTWSDYTDTEKMAIANQFLMEVGEYFPRAGQPVKTTPSGLTYSQIVNSTYYKAVYSMMSAVWQGDGSTPMQAWDAMYAGNTTLLTRAQAYNQTQHAVWVVLHDYGVPENTLTSDYIANEPLAK